LKFQKIDKFRNRVIWHFAKVRFSEDLGVWVQILSTFVVIALR